MERDSRMGPIEEASFPGKVHACGRHFVSLGSHPRMGPPTLRIGSGGVEGGGRAGRHQAEGGGGVAVAGRIAAAGARIWLGRGVPTDIAMAATA